MAKKATTSKATEKKPAAKSTAKKATATKPVVKKEVAKNVTKSSTPKDAVVINGSMFFPVFLKEFHSRFPYLGVEMMYTKSGDFLNDTNLPVSYDNNKKEVCIEDNATISWISEQFKEKFSADVSIYCEPRAKKYTHFYGTLRKSVPIIELNNLCKELGCVKNPK